MNKFAWRFGAIPILIIASLVLAACGGVDPAQVICPKNPAALPANERACKPNANENLDANIEVRVPALAVGSQQRAIVFGYAEDEKPILVSEVGYHNYPASQSVVLPLQILDFRTDSNPDGDFCTGQRPRCIAPIGGMTLEYVGSDGRVRTMTDVTINVVGSLRFIVDGNTAGQWLSLERTRTIEDFWFKYWDRVRTPKILSIVGSGIDPIADQWGEATNLALAGALTSRLAGCDLANLFELTDGVLTVKSVDIPASQEVGTNVDVQATQNAADRANAEAYATQRTIICAGMTDEVACAWQMQTFKGGDQNPPQVVVPPADSQAPAPETTPTP